MEHKVLQVSCVWQGWQNYTGRTDANLFIFLLIYLLYVWLH